MLNGFTRALLVTAAVTPAVMLPLGAAAYAQAAARPYSIPAQDLGSALQQLATQSGRDVVFDPRLTAGKKSRAVEGTVDAEQALRTMLQGSGLSYTTTSQGFAVRSAVGNAGAAGEVASSNGDAQSGSGANSQTILVTGSRLRAGNQAVPVKVYTRQIIEESGKTTAAEFLNTLPEVSVQSSQDIFSINGAGAGAQGVSLHGFPVGTTATLLNGRRLAPSAETSTDFDLNALPLAFIQRVDVLPSGSSAIYGSDAIAGVVNFITKRDVTGTHLSASVGQAAHYIEQNYSIGLGKTWDRGSVSILASYDTHDALYGKNRNIVANADYRRFAAQGGVDQRVTSCNPGNVFSTTAANLPGLISNVAAIRPGVVGTPSIGDFTATQGPQNLCSAFKDLQLIPAVDREGVLVNGRYQLVGSMEVFAELLYTHSNTSYVSDLRSFNGVVPASNAFNPFGASVRVSTELAIPSGQVLIRDYFRPLVGLRGQVSSNWHWEVAAWRSQDHSTEYQHARQQATPLAAALASSDPSTAINPFSSGSPGSASVLASVFPTRSNVFRFDVDVVDGNLRGELFHLPAGPVSIVIGGEYQWQRYFNDPTAIMPTSPITSVSRQVGAVYSELRAPILGARGISGDLLVVTLAGRYDRYNDFGSKATPQVGVEVRPTDHLLLRASYAQAFKAPELTQLYGSRSQFLIGALPDNGRPGSPIASNVNLILGANRQLKAETGQAYSLGFVWSRQVPGLTASLDYWRLREDNRIAFPTIAAVLGNPDIFPGRVVRDPSGVLLSVNDEPANFGSLRADGFDFSLSQKFETTWGEFTATADWVMTTKFMAGLTPREAPVNRLGQATMNDAWAVKNKATLGLDWTKGRYTLHASARYLGPYRDYPTSPPNSNRLGGYTLFDLSGRIDLSDLSSSKYVQHAALTGSIVNLFNRSPQFSNSGIGYDPAQADILGRVVRVGVTLDW